MDKYNQDKQQGSIDKQKIQECHQKAAEHHKNASELHKKAAQHYESGDHEKGHAAAHVAYGHTMHAADQASKACKHSAGISCKD